MYHSPYYIELLSTPPTYPLISVSLYLFCLYNCTHINRMKPLQKSGIGIKMGNDPTYTVNVLAYADDIVLLSRNENELQLLLNIVEKWCKKWRIRVNNSKTKIVHFHTKGQPCMEHAFIINNEMIEIVNEYKYLGIWVHCNLDSNATITNLSNAGLRALSQIIGKTRENYELGYS